MNIFERSNEIIVTAPKRMTPWLQKEMDALGYKTSLADTYVKTWGTMEDCIRLNCMLHSAHKVLLLLKKFRASGPDDLYANIRKIRWETVIPYDGYFTVSTFVHNDKILDTRFASLKVKDAIADRIKAEMGQRPDSGSEKDGAAVFLHWDQSDASIYIDTSGDTIAKHGYRKIPYRAPMRETLAAAAIIASRWTPGMHFINPMCGSGTLAIEAALMTIRKAPGNFRDNYAFMHFIGYDHDVYERIRKEVEGQVLDKLPDGMRIIATDRSREAIDVAKTNAKVAGVDHLISFEICDFADTPLPDAPGVIMINPEYGERLGELEELEVLYREMGDFFKQRAQGYTGYIFTGNLDLAKRIGLRTSRRIEFYNGTIDCRLLEYELYLGSKNKKNISDAEA